MSSCPDGEHPNGGAKMAAPKRQRPNVLLCSEHLQHYNHHHYYYHPLSLRLKMTSNPNLTLWHTFVMAPLCCNASLYTYSLSQSFTLVLLLIAECQQSSSEAQTCRWWRWWTCNIRIVGGSQLFLIMFVVIALHLFALYLSAFPFYKANMYKHGPALSACTCRVGCSNQHWW